MEFLDEVKVELRAGKGGDGIVSYRRELKVEYGGPYGGNGGRGGSIIFVGDKNLNTLLELRYKKVILAREGERGMKKGAYGRGAENTYIHVPLGTTIYNDDNQKIIADITQDGQEEVIAKGGRGGRGNMALATRVLKCPDYAEKGEPGEHKYIRCELKVLADCGLVGFPSVGKSTLISNMSNCKPRIASYHFTTLTPNLGMVRVDEEKSFVMADLPGLIEGASQGAGLGFEFLRHIERCRVIVHVIDMARTEGRDPYEDYCIINNELKTYKLNLSKRPQIVVANKMEMEGAKENLVEFKKKVPGIEVLEVSAINHTNLDELKYKIYNLLEQTPRFDAIEIDDKDVVTYEYSEEDRKFIITHPSDNYFYVEGKFLEKPMAMTNFAQEQAVEKFVRRLRSWGLDEELRKAGAKDGDTVDVMGFEFDFAD